MLAFETACFMVLFALVVACVGFAGDRHTNWGLATGMVTVLLSYGVGRFSGWARERYPHYFE